MLRERSQKGHSKTPADVRYPLEEHERSELPVARIDSGGTPPRTRASKSIKRGASRRSVARLAQSEHGRLEMGK